MTSIGTEKISHGLTTRLPLFPLLPVFARIRHVPRGPHCSDGHCRFSSLSPYRPSFNNSRGHAVVGLASFGAVAWPHVVGFTIGAYEPWKPTSLQIAEIIGGFVLFSLLLFWTSRREQKKDREVREYLKKGGKPRNWREYQAAIAPLFVRDVIRGAIQHYTEMGAAKETPHILTCPHGIIRYRPKIPKFLNSPSVFSKPENCEKAYEEVDGKILKLLETDPNLDLTKYASDLHIELVDFHRKGASPTGPRVFALKDIVLSYELKDPAKSPDEIEQQLRLILDAHPSADLNALAGDLGITIRNIQRKGDEGFQPYDLPIGTKSP